ncbi:MAG: spore germination protein [Clostridia bacterium]|nr:spore germination protein [Clostridia bacterium]
METLSLSLTDNRKAVKNRLPAEDILTFSFESLDGVECVLVYADGMVNKHLLGELVARPLQAVALPDGESRKDVVATTCRFPEIKELTRLDECEKEVLDGNALLLVDGISVAFSFGAKLLPVRSVTEPPTDVAVKGPREGFIEDVKTNMALVRKRLKSPDLRLQVSRIGRRSDTAVCLCYLEGIVNEDVKKTVEERLQKVDMDILPDSSYVAALISERKHSVFRSVGTTERPDVFAAKLAEGRVGMLVDGSPIALTLPFAQVEDFQSNEDYYVSPFMATIFRLLRLFSVMIALLAPALYVCSQLFKIQLLPLALTLTIAKSAKDIPLSPSMEMFLVLFVLEVLKEASIRMPKYVGMSLSVVGALVLGEAAVSAGFLSTPAIIVVAFSGICLYAVPNFVETGSILRWIFLIVAGSIGPFGLTVCVALVLYYMLTADSFGMPLLAPFAPISPSDLKDALVKYELLSLSKRPKIYGSKNRTRLSLKQKKQ